jgi:hypothetical protein
VTRDILIQLRGCTGPSPHQEGDKRRKESRIQEGSKEEGRLKVFYLGEEGFEPYQVLQVQQAWSLCFSMS